MITQKVQVFNLRDKKDKPLKVDMVDITTLEERFDISYDKARKICY